jgi:hypothetical protein
MRLRGGKRIFPCVSDVFHPRVRIEDLRLHRWSEVRKGLDGVDENELLVRKAQSEAEFQSGAIHARQVHSNNDLHRDESNLKSSTLRRISTEHGALVAVS